MAIQTSIGTPTATSYVSVASANSYFTARESADAWNDISSGTNATAATTRKENILKMATREIDRTYRFHDSKYNQGIKGQDEYQNLEFPRSSNLDADSNLFIPDEVKYATYEQALWILERSGKRTSEGGEVIEFQTIGDYSYNYMKAWINRQVQGVNKYSWQRSAF